MKEVERGYITVLKTNSWEGRKGGREEERKEGRKEGRQEAVEHERNVGETTRHSRVFFPTS